MAPLTINSKLRMNSGYEIPILGYGVYQTPADACEEVVSLALKAGYLHVDSAVVYRNEAPAAQALHKSGIPREDLFFTSKVYSKDLSYATAKTQIKETLKKTGFDYIDLMLIHAPYGGREARKGAWKALLEAQDEGKIRSLGVSNYGVHHLDEMEVYMKELEEERGKGKGGVIDVGQWELQPWCARPDIVEWCQKRDIVLEAYAPLVRGQRLDEPALQPLMKKYGKTFAQILMRWSLQKGFVPLPKSVTPSRIVENADVTLPGFSENRGGKEVTCFHLIKEQTYNTNVRGTFLTIKHFLLSAEEIQASSEKELDNLAIVVTGPECGKFGQAGYAEYASGKAGLQYSLVRGVKNEIVRLNSKERINAVAPGWVDTPLIEGRLGDPKEMWAEAQATVPLRKIAKPEDVPREMAFLASHRAPGHVTGKRLSNSPSTVETHANPRTGLSVSTLRKRKIKVLISIDFGAVSGFLGTGAAETNNMADYSSEFFAGHIVVQRLAAMDTPMKGWAQMTESQEREVIAKCVQLATNLTGKKPSGWRAPLYQIREHTVKVLGTRFYLQYFTYPSRFTALLSP
ncbi:hypothetical protein G7Y89_g7657 [Cudoniella acicularis]|uniref:NADP-dependent oxidoreductase domain-containing protein n=1 Tax=Cudoniella acicularis TaxID=354080 RepID=A0A8H4RI14_9HELO|nr:hypothetical protein G7Y89_g7657 [Cudoniella acicularis]